MQSLSHFRCSIAPPGVYLRSRDLTLLLIEVHEVICGDAKPECIRIVTDDEHRPYGNVSVGAHTVEIHQR